MLLNVVEMLKKKLGVEAIERNWFYSFGNVEDYFIIPSSLIIPDGCRKVGNSIFQYCTILKEVIISEGCKRIGLDAFKGCEKLEKLVIQEGVTDIEYCAFDGCRKLKEVIIPNSVKVIGSWAFRDCISAEITVGKSESKFEYFGYEVFWGCKRVRFVVC